MIIENLIIEFLSFSCTQLSVIIFKICRCGNRRNWWRLWPVYIICNKSSWSAYAVWSYRAMQRAYWSQKDRLCCENNHSQSFTSPAVVVVIDVVVHPSRSLSAAAYIFMAIPESFVHCGCHITCRFEVTCCCIPWIVTLTCLGHYPSYPYEYVEQTNAVTDDVIAHCQLTYCLIPPRDGEALWPLGSYESWMEDTNRSTPHRACI